MQLHNWFNYNVVPPVVEAIVFLVKKSLLAYLVAVNDRKSVFHFRPKPNIWPEKHLALGRIPKPNVLSN